MDNKIRTPRREHSEEKIEKKIEKEKKEIIKPEMDTSAQIKIYLAEIYTKGQKIEELKNELEEKGKVIECSNKKIKSLEEELSKMEDKMKKENEKAEKEISDLKTKNSLLQKTSEYGDIVSFYEEKLTEYNQRNIETVKMFSQSINKLMKESFYSNKDDMWRKVLKNYENKVCDLEEKIEKYKANERKMKSRQIFFEKYCYKAEKKIEEISKISKKFEEEQKSSSAMISDYKKEIASQKNQNEIYKKTIEALKNGKKKNPNSLDWQKIKAKNEKNFSMISEKISKKKNKKSNQSNILILLSNIEEFINSILITQDDNASKDSMSNIIADVKSYFEMLLDKIDVMSMNQCYVIKTCCDVWEALQNVPLVQSNEIDSLMSSLKVSCEKLTNDFKP